VVLFDEIEKAHPDVLNILLQILDDGIITDSHGRQVDFSNTVIVMTTNAGSTNFTAAAGFTTDTQMRNTEKTNKALAEFLRPEFLNRVDEVITFRQLEPDDFAKIARIMLGDLAKVLEKKGIDITFTDEAVKYIAEKSYSVKYGARNMRRFIQMELEDKIAGEMIDRKGNVRAVSVSVKDGEGLVLAVI